MLERQWSESTALLDGYLQLYQIHSATLESGVLDDTAVLDEWHRHWVAQLSDAERGIEEQLQKEQLSAFIVHDLKNPVSSMDLQAQLALRSADLPDKTRAALQRIRDDFDAYGPGGFYDAVAVRSGQIGKFRE